MSGLRRPLLVAMAVAIGGCAAQTNSQPPRAVRFIPQSASFISRSMGWAWGPAWWPQAGVQTPGVLAQTRDGGRTWQRVPVPNLSYGSLGPGISGVRFISARVGYLFGGDGLLQTSDGGASWRRIPIPGRVTDVEAGGDAAYALTSDQLYRIGRRLSTIGPHQYSSSLVIRGSGLYLLGAGRALRVSHDRGASWRRLRIPCVFGGGGSALAAWSPYALALACGGEPGAGNQPKTFYSSTDGGLRWVRARGPRFGMTAGYVASLTAVNRRTWILAEARGGILITHDGGRHWDTPRWRGPVAAVEGWGHISFIGRTHAVAVPWTLNGGVLALTADGGRTWREVSFRALPAPSPRRPRIHPTRGWARYWTDVNPGSAVQFVSGRTGFALGPQAENKLDDGLVAPTWLDVTWPSPALRVSRDGGRTWRRSLSASTGFWGLDFPDSEHGWAVGVTSLYSTVDGGRQWWREKEPVDPLVRVSFTDRWRGAGLTTGGRLVRSDDGGMLWRGTRWSRRSGALCWPPRGRIVLAGLKGALWRSTSAGRSFTQVAPMLTTAAQYAGWWVDLSCAGRNLVAFAQANCEAACGGGVESIVRQSTDGGLTWHRRTMVDYGAANPSGPVAIGAIAVGSAGECVLETGSPLALACAGNRGGPLRRATEPHLPRSTRDEHFLGAAFLTPSSGWLGLGRQIWATRDGGASWHVVPAAPGQR